MLDKLFTYMHGLLICLVCSLTYAALSSCTAGHGNGQEYRVLIIQSYRSDCLWGEELNKGAMDCFKKNKVKAVFDIFHLDSEVMSKSAMSNQLRAYLYEIEKPDLILVSADQALEALLTANHRNAFEVPVVFSGINYYKPDCLEGHPNITGFVNTPQYEKNIRLIRDLFPQTKKIYLHVDDSPMSRLAVDSFKEQMARMTDPLPYQVTNMDEMDGARFLWDAEDEEHTVRIMPVWNSFYFGMARNVSNPYFAANSKGFGYGYLGGYMTPSYDQMYMAAEVGIQLLQGRSATMFPVKETEQIPVFDWVQMQKFNISLEQLPKEAVVIHISFVERYLSQLIVASIVLFIVLLLVVIILFSLSKEARSSKRKAQQEIVEHRNKLKIAMMSIGEGVISIDRNMTIFSINPAAMQWLSLEGRDTDYIGKHILNLINVTGPLGQNLEQLILNVFEKGKTVTFRDDYSMRSILSGERFPVSGEISVINQRDELYGAVIVFANDMEEKTRKQFLALTLEVGGYTSWRFNPVKRSLVLDPVFMHSHRIENNGTNSIPLSRFREMLHPDDLKEWETVNNRLIRGELENHVFTLRIDLNGEGYKWWEIRFTCLRSLNSNEIPLIFGLCCDVDESIQALEALQEARDKAQLSDKLKSAFLANMSHEIRTPLNAIVGFSNVLTSGEDFDQEERRLFVNTIKNNCNLLLGLISDVLDMAQIESGSMHYKDEVCDVNELIDQIIISQRVIIPDHIRLIEDIPDQTSYILTDKLRLNQVITNLINNAVKFTEKGSVTVGYSRDEKGFHFYVEDTGRGIPEKDINNIFQRFFKKDDFAQGAGLGLSICRMIVDHYNGTIGVTSEVGKGSRFTVSVPFVCATAEEISVTASEDEKLIRQNIITKIKNMNSIMDNQQSQDRVTLLIAEDEESNYLLLKTVLQKQCNLIRARTGKEALALFKENSEIINLIMLDIKMPEMTGIEALVEIRKLSKDIPVIMQSAYVFDTDMESARQAGASDFITKPINLKILKLTISKYCPSVQW